MDYREEIKVMNSNKLELIEIINAIQNPKIVKYLLGFVKSFIELRS